MGDTQNSEAEAPLREPPKRFLFCIPWIRSRKTRSQIVQCFVSGLFLILLTTVCKFSSFFFSSLLFFGRMMAMISLHQSISHAPGRTLG